MITTDTRRTAADLGPGIAVALTELLGENWSYRPSDSDYQPEHYGQLVHDDLRISIATAEWQSKGRVVLAGEFNHLGVGHGMRYGLTTEITVADSRTSAVIAKEINRRLLPDYQISLATAKERVQTEQARKAGLEKAVTTVLAAAGPDAVRRDGTIYPHLNGVYELSSHFDGTSWSMKLTDLPVETVVKVLALIRAEKP